MQRHMPRSVIEKRRTYRGLYRRNKKDEYKTIVIERQRNNKETCYMKITRSSVNHITKRKIHVHISMVKTKRETNKANYNRPMEKHTKNYDRERKHTDV